MFILTTIADTVRIPPTMLAQPTLNSVHSEMDKKYPNRVVMDVGLVIGRYGDALQVGDGVCAAGDGGAHHEIIVKLIVFRPFVDEVCLGTISKSSAEGLFVSMGFFDDIFIPAYWMLRPSHFEKGSGLWIWTPSYDDDDQHDQVDSGDSLKHDDGKDLSEENRFEMSIGAEVRFKVKSINFTQVTNTAKGVQATTTTTAHSIKIPNGERSMSVGSGTEVADNTPVRKRSTSIDLGDSHSVPASMHIVASICEDGLGLTSWWASMASNEDDESVIE